MAIDSALAVAATITRQSFPIAGEFRISRGAKTQADVITLTLQTGGATGWGECVPYARYGETLTSVESDLTRICQNRPSLGELNSAVSELKAGAARNALDCALWDLRCKLSGDRAYTLLEMAQPKPVVTAYTLSLDTPDAMGQAARSARHRALIKIKLGGPDDIACMRAVTDNAPNSQIIVDANEGWSTEALPALMAEAARLGIALIEQPLPAGNDALLATIERPVPVCADESAHTSADLDGLVGKYDAINIKLDKAGGLTEALAMRDAARQKCFSIMVGCMVGSSLAMAPAVLLAQGADFADLDGPLLLAKDRTPALQYAGDTVAPPQPDLWG